MRARYYDAGTGRFLKEDPIGFEGGLNVSLYVGGNPVVGIDPSGLACTGSPSAIRTCNELLFPGPPGSVNDALKHANGARDLTDLVGPIIAEQGLTIVEIGAMVIRSANDAITGSSPANGTRELESRMDVINNAEGIIASQLGRRIEENNLVIFDQNASGLTGITQCPF